MNFYVASSFSNHQSVRYVSRQLKCLGYTHTYDWTLNGRARSLEELRTVGMNEKQGVEDAQFVIVLLPGGNGTHTELGIAISLRKQIYLHTTEEALNDLETTCTFYHLPEVTHCTGSLDDLVSLIQNDQKIKKHTV
ncbi:group-specific protein [Bacillus sp. FJAT-45037]|uniref:group-specific protein n=1 Tax=Bacillus sp. FJAT-45037 TaxID=2011007 RepID=UPI000C24BCFD|nr:group-specific protein [Bacillus sp. FJAT-45037]